MPTTKKELILDLISRGLRVHRNRPLNVDTVTNAAGLVLGWVHQSGNDGYVFDEKTTAMPPTHRRMRTRYLYINPRGFANEYGIYRVSTPAQLAEAQRVIAAHANDTSGRACFISRGEADAKCRANRREAKMNVRGGLNLSQNPVACTEIVDLELSE
jgi:hypothetical protein